MTLPEHTRQPLGPNQERWIQALESGNFDQTTGILRAEDHSFCCLGVACETFGMKARRSKGAWWYSNKTEVAPPTIVRQLALFDESGSPLSDSERLALTELNDEGASFSEIAAIIRADPSVYFKEPR